MTKFLTTTMAPVIREIIQALIPKEECIHR